MADERETIAIPLVEERLATSKREVETGRVRVSTIVEEIPTLVREQLAETNVEVERVPINIEVDRIPPVRQEGDTIIVPVVQEVLVVEKRLIVTEEIRLHRSQVTKEYTQPVILRSQRASVEREATSGETKPATTGENV